MIESYNRSAAGGDKAMILRQGRNVLLIIGEILFVICGVLIALAMLYLSPIENTKVPCNQTTMDSSGHYGTYNACER